MGPNTRAARRNALPWSDRSILLVSALVVLLITPLWLDPVTVGEFIGVLPAATHCAADPTLASEATPAPGASVAPGSLPPGECK